MAEPFIGEIKMVGFTFAPRGYAFCNGQLLSIAQNTALFSLIGTTFGGNGTTTFALPNLQDRTPVHSGNMPGGAVHVIGEMSGSTTHTLTGPQAGHSHTLKASANQASTTSPAGNVLAAKRRGGTNVYRAGADADTTLDATTVSGIAGGGQPHSNMQPYLGLNFTIALEGIYPSRN